MKNLYLLLITLFLFAQCIYSQNNNSSIYSYNNIVSITNATIEQQNLLAGAIHVRDSINAISNTEEERKIAFEGFFSVFNDIFNETQKLKVYSSKQKYPKNYMPIFFRKLDDFQNEINQINQEFEPDTSLRNELIDEIKFLRKNWITKQKSLLKRVKLSSGKILDSCNNFQLNKNKLIEYHFYAKLVDSQNSTDEILELLTNLKNDTDFESLVEVIIDCGKNLHQEIYNHPPLNTFDSIANSKVDEKLEIAIRDIVNGKIENNKPLKVFLKLSIIKKLAKEIGREINLELKAIEKVSNQDELIAKAIDAGLDEERVNQLVLLVNKQLEELKAFKVSKKRANNSEELIEDSSTKKIYQIRKEFNQQLIQLISLKEFTKIFGDQLRKNARLKMREQYKFIITSYKFSEEQKGLVSKFVYSYFYKEAILNQYYKYDKAIFRQKMNFLKHAHEKKYKKLLQNFGIEANKIKKIDKNTFQWN